MGQRHSETSHTLRESSLLLEEPLVQQALSHHLPVTCSLILQRSRGVCHRNLVSTLKSMAHTSKRMGSAGLTSTDRVV